MKDPFSAAILAPRLALGGATQALDMLQRGELFGAASEMASAAPNQMSMLLQAGLSLVPFPAQLEPSQLWYSYGSCGGAPEATGSYGYLPLPTQLEPSQPGARTVAVVVSLKPLAFLAVTPTWRLEGCSALRQHGHERLGPGRRTRGRRWTRRWVCSATPRRRGTQATVRRMVPFSPQPPADSAV